MQAALAGSQGARAPHMITVVGEAGVGKSRLLDEFTRWLDRAVPAGRYLSRAAPTSGPAPSCPMP